MKTYRIVMLALAVGCSATWWGCSGGGGTKDGGADASTDTGGGTDAKKEASGQDAAADDTGTDSSPGPILDPVCTVPVDAGSNGSCVTLTGDGGIECNPVTNVPCNAGEACDISSSGPKYHCYAPLPNNTATTCQTCDVQNGPACIGTETCVGTDAGVACARYCCDDTDCGNGHCDKTSLNTAPAGVCVK